MKKRFYLFLVVVILIAVTGLPFLYGFVFKTKFNEMVAVVNHDQVFQLDIVDYHRGWISSTAKIKVQPGLQVQSNPKIKAFVDSGNAGFILELSIHHGPIIYNPIEHNLSLAYGTLNGFISLPEQIEKFIFGKKQSNGFMQFNVVSAFGGNWFSQYQSPSTVLPGPAGVTARWDGMDAALNASINTNNEVEKYYSKLTLNTFVISPEGNPPGIPHVNIQPITYEGSMDRTNNQVIKSAFSIRSMVIENPKTVLLVNGFTQNQITTIIASSNTINFNAETHWDNIYIPAMMFTPLNKSSLYLSVNQINRKEFLDMLAYTRSIKRQMTPDELAHLQTLIPKIISPKTMMSMDVGLTTPEGTLIANTKINWAAELPAQMSMMGLMQQANVSVAFRVSVPLAEAVIAHVNAKKVANQPATVDTMPISATLTDPTATVASTPTPTPVATAATDAKATLQQYVELGYLLKDKNDYVSALTYQKGVLMANGHEVDLKK